jgi:aspartyl-tRNA(Asn)/glutamyl-tRNA(Gln) amidotransferase subunit C
MKITRENVIYVAELANLELTEAEVEMYRGQLDAILTYIDKLKQLDVSNVEPMAQVLFEAGETGSALEDDATRAASDAEDLRSNRAANPALRADKLVPCEVAEAVLEGAPDASKPYFRVPKVIDR